MELLIFFIIYSECKEVRLDLINLIKDRNATIIFFYYQYVETSDTWVVIRATKVLIDYKTEEVVVLATIHRLENSDVLLTMKIIEILWGYR